MRAPSAAPPGCPRRRGDRQPAPAAATAYCSCTDRLPPPPTQCRPCSAARRSKPQQVQPAGSTSGSRRNARSGIVGCASAVRLRDRSGYSGTRAQRGRRPAPALVRAAPPPCRAVPRAAVPPAARSPRPGEGAGRPALAHRRRREQTGEARHRRRQQATSVAHRLRAALMSSASVSPASAASPHFAAATAFTPARWGDPGPCARRALSPHCCLLRWIARLTIDCGSAIAAMTLLERLPASATPGKGASARRSALRQRRHQGRSGLGIPSRRIPRPGHSPLQPAPRRLQRRDRRGGTFSQKPGPT